MTADLVAFLNARLDETQAKAEESDSWYWAPIVLADIAAKRRIVKAVDQAMFMHITQPSEVTSAGLGALTLVALCLALPYADHEDYQPEWKP
jgi:hypothetical protein